VGGVASNQGLRPQPRRRGAWVAPGHRQRKTPSVSCAKFGPQPWTPACTLRHHGAPQVAGTCWFQGAAWCQRESRRTVQKGLENRRPGNRPVGSNPTPSATVSNRFILGGDVIADEPACYPEGDDAPWAVLRQGRSGPGCAAADTGQRQRVAVRVVVVGQHVRGDRGVASWEALDLFGRKAHRPLTTGRDIPINRTCALALGREQALEFLG
jgi:hypothetical protein